jgi:hypothetical protein
MICTLSTILHRSTQKHLHWHSITKILRNGPRAHFPFKNLLTIVALSSVQLTLHCTQPILGVHGVSRMGKDRGMAPHELRMLVSRHQWHLNLHLRLRWGLLLLHLLHCC